MSPRPLAICVGCRIIAEADIAVESLRWDIEIDGPHHDTLEMRVRDARRDGGLSDIDWVTSRYPTAILDRSPNTFAEQVDRDMALMIERRRGQAAA